MLNHATSSVFEPRPIEVFASNANVQPEPEMTEESLPFTVKLVHNLQDLSKAVQIRHAAYARHLPGFAETLKSPESADAENGVVVLLAESKLDGSPLGTMRIQTNQFKPLCLEQSVELPEWLKTRPLAEATRLGVSNEKGGRLITTVLFKAYYQYCMQIGIEWMVIAGRAPVDRMYDRLLFSDVFPDLGYIPLVHAGNLPHRVLSFNVQTARARWSQAKHPLLGFMCNIHHPDIRLGHLEQINAMPMEPQVYPGYPLNPNVLSN
jgi:hypothetical protein